MSTDAGNNTDGSQFGNPAIQAIYKKLTAFRSSTGLNAEIINSLSLEEFQFAEVYCENIRLTMGGNSPINSTVTRNSLFVGKLNLKIGSITQKYCQLFSLNFSNGFLISNVSFAHFDSSPTFLTTQNRHNNVIFSENLKFLDVSSFQITLDRDVRRDLDGSLTSLTGGGSIVKSDLGGQIMLLEKEVSIQ